MTITQSARPTHNGPVALARGFLTGGVIGTSLAALVVGGVIESVPLFLTGMGLPVIYGALLFISGRPRRAREAAVTPRTALAMIESLRAIGGESADIPIQFILSVAPDDAPAYRADITQSINLVDVPHYRPRDVLVVEYPPDRPWRVRIVERPKPEWERRAAEARIDSASESTVAQRPPEGCAFGAIGLIGLLLGAAALTLAFRADLLGPESATQPPDSAKPSVSSTSSTSVTSSSGMATVTVGPNQSLLDRGELRQAVESLTEAQPQAQSKGKRPALSVVVQEQLMTVVLAPTDVPAPQFDPGSLPYERIPALVKEARTTLGVRSPQTWQLSADHFTGSLTIRITVTGPGGGASLHADGKGKVTRRSPAL
ncbi:hypothetical protein ABCR94_15735 [Streptomyces sp. 21So2-11]|uniref:hypothetical protein n=1 Tax=Streptomyces sp. 21So2-11 TaxID=3144408 RepID=UPI00321B9CFF